MVNRPKHILIVEDNELNRDLLVQLLEDVGEISEAHNGLEAVKMAQANPPDLILMDLSMPVLSGWDATFVLKRRAATKTIPVVAVSARTMRDEVSRARQAGVDDFVALPLDESRLYDVVGRHLGLPPARAAEQC